ncbi:glycoside hydrolase domain-containing protein [Thermaerobacillus caldiproteolyticus]|uniref:Rv2525c-like glycoside hydrolase-like domain-containing protein n=1 Tax=Thermaerobacillus caldiproteolyticus TaxID=247480 RepID=A0A7V9Z5A9_9BACL|nr:glycoside hydrolase domain-containing protein [Anoxybacillus caldiproteolyticus]MBA2874185.1 hypothetical protein [Anoxybacillus caldiproteolyticus]QPA31873.1 DUF1906 domain-containing protein [Anoxybacillus caldiproteolyticus]
MARAVWGVDSAARATEQLFYCVKNEFGYPKFWGRYLTDVPNVSDGLNKEEITLLRNYGIKVMPIYNVFREAVGYANGQVAARNAIFHARRLGIPKNKVLFANIEDYFPVDEGWIRGWVETLYPTGYRPGLYADPTKGDFSNAYCEAVQQNNQVAVQTMIWSAAPRPGTTKEQKAPKYQPATPNCKANVWAWQYGRDAETCPIDTNLADRRLLEFLY